MPPAIPLSTGLAKLAAGVEAAGVVENAALADQATVAVAVVAAKGKPAEVRKLSGRGAKLHAALESFDKTVYELIASLKDAADALDTARRQ